MIYCVYTAECPRTILKFIRNKYAITELAKRLNYFYLQASLLIVMTNGEA